jgi:hypothetical protein
VGEREDAGTTAGAGGRSAASSSSSGRELRELAFPQQRLGGYARKPVDGALARAAQTIDHLFAQVNDAEAEITRLRATQAQREHEMGPARGRSAHEVVGEVLVTAHHAAEALLDGARRQARQEQDVMRREALGVLTAARKLLEDATGVRQDAQATLDAANAQAEALIEAGRREADRLVAAATELASRRNAQLELEYGRLETAISGLRSEWVGRAAEALVRLDDAGPGRSPPPASSSGARGVLAALNERLLRAREEFASRDEPDEAGSGLP